MKRDLDPADPAQQPALRRRLALSYAAAALLLLGLMALILAGRDRPVAARTEAPAATTTTTSEDPITGTFTRRALNALLVPLLDDGQPLRWTDVAVLHFCGPGTRVEIDGQPMVPGALVPASAFRVRWHIDRCWPLDYASFELSGVVELAVYHEREGLGAVVDAHRLRIATARGTGRVGAPFTRSMAIGGFDPVHAP